jgi:undecaprenyl diphosphate synthase
MIHASATRLPRHIAIVMDGNGRWAKRRRRPRSFGHHAGLKAIRSVVKSCLQQNMAALTLFAFSSENWQRPAEEVSALMELFVTALDKEVDELNEYGVRLCFIGDLDAFTAPLHKRMLAAMQRTADNTALRMNIAVNYGGRWDIVQASRRLAAAAVAGELDPAAIDEAQLDTAICLAEQPPVDLFIRTGGEHRISNFLLWQLAYAELYFTNTLWPDFDQTHLAAAIDDFSQRERRYGRIGAKMT